MNSSLGLSFVTQQDFLTYYNAFLKGKSPNSNSIDGNSARDILMRSGLSPQILYKIWNLSDIDNKGELSALQFVLALHLAKVAIAGGDVPDSLPESVKNEIAEKTNHIQNGPDSNNPIASDTQNKISTPGFSGPSQNPPSSTSYTKEKMDAVDTLESDFEKRFPDVSRIDSISVEPTVNTSVRSFPLNTSQNIEESIETMRISGEDRRIYEGQFTNLDSQKTGFISGEMARDLFMKSGLPPTELSQIWQLVDTQKRGKLNKNEYAAAMYLITSRLKGSSIPTTLPKGLIAQEIQDLDKSLMGLREKLLTKSAGNFTGRSPIARATSPGSDSTSYSKSSRYSEDADVPKSSRRHGNRSKETFGGKNASYSTNRNPNFSKEGSQMSDLEKLVMEKEQELANLKSGLGYLSLGSSNDRFESQISQDEIRTSQKSDYSNFGFSEYNSNTNFHKHTDRSLADLPMKQQIFIIKNILHYVSLTRRYNHAFAELENHKKSLEARNASLKSKSPSKGDAASRAAARIAERMKALTGATYDFNLGQPENDTNPETETEFSITQGVVDSIKQEIGHTKTLILNFDISNPLENRTVKELCDYKDWDKSDEDAKISYQEFEILVDDLCPTSKGHIRYDQIIHYTDNDMVYEEPEKITESNSPFNDFESRSSYSPFVLKESDNISVATPVSTVKSVMKSEYFEPQGTNSFLDHSNQGSPASQRSEMSTKKLQFSKSKEDRKETLKKLAEQRLLERQRQLGLVSDDDSENTNVVNKEKVSSAAPVFSSGGPKLNEARETTVESMKQSESNISIANPFYISKADENEKLGQESNNLFFDSHHDAIYDVEKSISAPKASTNPPYTIDTNNTRSKPTSPLIHSPPSNKTEHFQSTAATLFSKLYGSPNSNGGQFKNSLELDLNDDDSSDSSVDFFDSEYSNIPKNQDQIPKFGGKDPFDNTFNRPENGLESGSDFFSSVFSVPNLENENTEDTEPTFYRSKSLYNPQSTNNELTLDIGDIIVIDPERKASANGGSNKYDEKWMYGQKLIIQELVVETSGLDSYQGWVGSGVYGWFPRVYVERIGTENAGDWDKYKAKYGICVHDYNPQKPRELAITKGSRVRILNDIDSHLLQSNSRTPFDSDDNDGYHGNGWTKVCMALDDSNRNSKSPFSVNTNLAQIKPDGLLVGFVPSSYISSLF
ncbi:hypothetical protein BB558_005796 [Smittium angustum]|uniref:Actin cytoskeleton-regulatory complex protein PAN1 n=1 Tax=Smittium angustum TaxID=133377 RepID=A0A2U1IZH9_SMIAN|nr:hypothetical protein BB558_005796 [Smittium angustum]